MSERSRDTHSTLVLLEFSEFTFEFGLMDLPLIDGNCTWSNNCDPPSWSKIDRFLLSQAQFPNASQRRLPILLLDHFHLLLDCVVVVTSKGYFKFENMWLKSNDFMDKVKQWWMTYSFQGSPNFFMARKLKALKSNLKTME